LIKEMSIGDVRRWFHGRESEATDRRLGSLSLGSTLQSSLSSWWLTGRRAS